jgi:hypothetical protein
MRFRGLPEVFIGREVIVIKESHIILGFRGHTAAGTIQISTEGVITSGIQVNLLVRKNGNLLPSYNRKFS